MAENPLTRIYINDEGDIVVTDLWKQLAEKLAPHFKGDSETTFCPLPEKSKEPEGN